MQYSLILSLAIVMGCGGGTPTPTPNSTDGSDGLTPERIASVENNLEPAGDANFSLYLIDAPSDFSSVTININEVSVKKKNDSETSDEDEDPTNDAGWITISEDAQSIDLLKLQGDVSELIGSFDLEAGTYTEIRLTVETASATLSSNNEEITLQVPSNKTKIKLKSGLIIEEGSATQLVLDFDADKSIVGPCRNDKNDKKKDTPAADKAPKADNCNLFPVIKEATRVKKVKK